MARRIIVGISGASGIVYGVRALQLLRDCGVETHLVMSKSAKLTLHHEMDMSLADVEALAGEVHAVKNIGASIASGSFATDGMLIAPCSVRTMSEIATGVTSTLLTRAADVVLKERRRLVLLVRETPLNLVHLRNMVTVTEMGGVVFPPLPAFYHRPQTITEMVDHTCGRVLDLFGIEQDFSPRWAGLRAR